MYTELMDQLMPLMLIASNSMTKRNEQRKERGRIRIITFSNSRLLTKAALGTWMMVRTQRLKIWNEAGVVVKLPGTSGDVYDEKHG